MWKKRTVYSHIALYFSWKSVNLLVALKRWGNMWNNEDTVSHLGAICFVSADLGLLVLFDLILQGYDGSCKDTSWYYWIMYKRMCTSTYHKDCLNIRYSIDLKLGDYEFYQVTFISFTTRAQGHGHSRIKDVRVHAPITWIKLGIPDYLIDHSIWIITGQFEKILRRTNKIE